VVLATLAAIIASQAVISGAFSMTRQSMLMGFLPRMAVRHTSAREQGQIYLPLVNWACWWACWRRCWPSAARPRWPGPMVWR
jgi:KUP system potassium uptake protein